MNGVSKGMVWTSFCPRTLWVLRGAGKFDGVNPNLARFLWEGACSGVTEPQPRTPLAFVDKGEAVEGILLHKDGDQSVMQSVVLFGHCGRRAAARRNNQ